MNKNFTLIKNHQINDAELTNLLTQVYVDGGFTDVQHATTLFEASTVRQRGTLIGLRENHSSNLAGVVMLVPFTSNACRLAQNNEAEMHLLAVHPTYRGYGLGKQLVQHAISTAKSHGFSKMVLWTQDTMVVAQKLYESFGFTKTNQFEKNGRRFFVYELVL